MDFKNMDILTTRILLTAKTFKKLLNHLDYISSIEPSVDAKLELIYDIVLDDAKNFKRTQDLYTSELIYVARELLVALLYLPNDIDEFSNYVEIKTSTAGATKVLKALTQHYKIY